MINTVIRTVGLTALALCVASCGSTKPSNYYLLNDLTPTKAKKVRNVNQTVIGIGPVVLAKYLNQPQIVTRSNLNKLKIDEFNRWAEPLDDNFTRVLSKNVQNILQSNHIATYPWQHSESITYQVKVDVNRFDATENGKILCDVRYQILKNENNERLLSKTKTYTENIGENFNYTQLAYCMSKIVARISRDLAQDLRVTTRKLPFPKP